MGVTVGAMAATVGAGIAGKTKAIAGSGAVVVVVVVAAGVVVVVIVGTAVVVVVAAGVVVVVVVGAAVVVVVVGAGWMMATRAVALRVIFSSSSLEMSSLGPKYRASTVTVLSTLFVPGGSVALAQRLRAGVVPSFGFVDHFVGVASLRGAG